MNDYLTKPYSHMTVKELIEKLQEYADSEKPVFSEGCDCDGEAGGVHEENGYILIKRA